MPTPPALSFRSRYRGTRLKFDRTGRLAEGRPFFGLWSPPVIIETKPTITHRVVSDEVTRPDLVSWRVYEDPTLFWVIALRNGFLLPITDMRPGQLLICPNIEDVMAGLQNADIARE